MNIQFLSTSIAVLFICLAQIIYVYDTYKRKIKPHVMSWLGWSVLMGISFVSQYMELGWSVNLISLLLSTVGCVVIAGSAFFIFKHYAIDKNDWIFLTCGFICVLIYILSNNAWMTTITAIIADFIFGIPTIKHAYTHPSEERVLAWPLALSSWVFTFVMLLFDFSWLHALWPVYLILFHLVMTYPTYIKPLFDKRPV